MTATDTLQEARRHFQTFNLPWSYASVLDLFEWDASQPAPTQEQFDAFTADINTEERCQHCGGDDYNVMELSGGVVCYNCGRPWLKPETLMTIAKRRAVRA